MLWKIDSTESPWKVGKAFILQYILNHSASFTLYIFYIKKINWYFIMQNNMSKLCTAEVSQFPQFLGTGYTWDIGPDKSGYQVNIFLNPWHAE